MDIDKKIKLRPSVTERSVSDMLWKILDTWQSIMSKQSLHDVLMKKIKELIKK